MPTRHCVVWFRRDLRLGDNPAWSDATSAADEVTALFVLDPALYDRAGRFRRATLAEHLVALDDQLRRRGGRLRLVHGDPIEVVPRVAAELDATVVWNDDVTPYASTRDAAVAAALGDNQRRHWGTLVHRPGSVLTKKGTLSRVFTPFARRWNDVDLDPWPSGEGTATVADDPGDGMERLVSSADGASGALGGEIAARGRLQEFLRRVDGYGETRDLPAVLGTSQLSGDLRFGTLSPREVAGEAGDETDGRRSFVRQLAWRDWYAHLLYENPTMITNALRAEYDAIKWRNDPAEFEAWKAGHTGFPIVDAGIRQLLETGWMHNRVRMIVGSFLVKDLLIDWRWGERFFRHLLVDADVSQNVGNWQWVAGCGTDAAPYFRVFNPWTQSRKFDPEGDYIRRWVPELGGLSPKAIHEPAAEGPLELAAAGVVLGDNYPEPMVDHAMARERALATYKAAVGKDLT